MWFWGYKLGLLTSQSGVVLGVALIKANRVERHATHRLLRTAEATLRETFGKIPIKYLMCDAGFAGEKTYEQTHRILKCRVLSPPRRQRMKKKDRKTPDRWEYKTKLSSPHRYRDWKFWKTPTAKRMYRKREAIERQFSQLTDEPFWLDRKPRGTVGLRPILRYELAKLILWHASLNENIINQRQLRRVKVYVA